MSYLANILEAIKNDINEGTFSELKLWKKSASNSKKLPEQQIIKELSTLTKAVIDTVKQNTFTPLKIYLSWMCKVRIEQNIRLSDIMSIFDLYEQSLKDAMSLYLQEDLVSLNRYRREIDTLLDKARVYVSDYFFVLYEDTVFKQFDQLRIINEITAHLTSTLKLNEVSISVQ